MSVNRIIILTHIEVINPVVKIPVFQSLYGYNFSRRDTRVLIVEIPVRDSYLILLLKELEISNTKNQKALRQGMISQEFDVALKTSSDRFLSPPEAFLMAMSESYLVHISPSSLRGQAIACSLGALKL